MSSPDEVDALIEQFQKSGLRELHVRCGEVEIYLSTDAAGAGIFRAGSPPSAQAAGGAAAQVAAGDGGPAARPGDAAPAPARPAVAPPAAAPVAAAWPAEATLVRAPYLGTFYRAPKPGAPAYVEMGTRVLPETELCMVEVMKLFTALRAGIRGKVHAVLAEDGQLVQAQQPLFVLLPS